MIHLSEVLGMPVYLADGERIGRVEDLQVEPVHGKVEWILVRRRRAVARAPWAATETFSIEMRRVVLSEPPQPVPNGGGAEGETVWLKRDVLDRQIIDIHGRKVVRVNDILLETSDGSLVLRRVEVGLAGAVRRLFAGVISPRLVRQAASGLSERGIPWEYVGLVEPRSARIRLKVHQHLARMHPADLADILEDLGRMERHVIVSSMDPETAADALSEAEPEVQASVVEGMHVDKAADVLEEMQPDEAADILGDLPKKHSRVLLDAMEDEEADDVRELLSFGEDTAGGLMTTDFFKAGTERTVGQVLTDLRQVDEDLASELDEIPIVGDKNRLVGVAPLVRLARAAADEPVTVAMRRETRAVTPATPLKEVVARFEKYHLRALAVTDEFGILVGLINIDDVFRRLASED